MSPVLTCMPISLSTLTIFRTAAVNFLARVSRVVCRRHLIRGHPLVSLPDVVLSFSVCVAVVDLDMCQNVQVHTQMNLFPWILCSTILLKFITAIEWASLLSARRLSVFCRKEERKKHTKHRHLHSIKPNQQGGAGNVARHWSQLTALPPFQQAQDLPDRHVAQLRRWENVFCRIWGPEKTDAANTLCQFKRSSLGMYANSSWSLIASEVYKFYVWEWPKKKTSCASVGTY